MTKSRYTTTIATLHSPSDIAQSWQILHAEARESFFLSWPWVETWLQTYRLKPFVVCVKYDEKPVALALFCSTQLKRHKILRSKALLLMQTGYVEEDQIWIEYNRILSHPEHKEAATEQVFSSLLNRPDWDEIQMGASLAGDIEAAQQYLNLYRHDLWQAPTYQVQLDKIRQNEGGYLAVLSRNTRYQIRRAIKQWEGYAPICVQRAQNLTESMAFFTAAGKLHRLRWKAQSGFKNPKFVAFHQALIENHWPNGCVDLLCIRCGDHVIGYLYNFLMHGTVHFYLSGIDYNQYSDLKPGLVVHALAIQEYLEQGFDVYDFMGGESQYKRSLGKCSGQLLLSSFQRPKNHLLLERGLRYLKHAIFKK